jgi:hypothetical protein
MQDVTPSLPIERESKGPDSARLRDIVEESLQYEERFNRDWVKANHYSNLGFHFEARYQKSKRPRDRDSAIHYLRKGYDLYSTKRIIPEPSMISGLAGPDQSLIRLGCDVQLIPPRGAFPLTDAALRRILDIVVA